MSCLRCSRSPDHPADCRLIWAQEVLITSHSSIINLRYIHTQFCLSQEWGTKHSPDVTGFPCWLGLMGLIYLWSITLLSGPSSKKPRVVCLKVKCDFTLLESVGVQQHLCCRSSCPAFCSMQEFQSWNILVRKLSKLCLKTLPVF